MKAKRLPSGAWSVNVYLGVDSDGKDIRKRFTGADKKTVLQEASVFVSEHRSVDDDTTLRSACQAAIQRPKLSPATVAGYEVCYRYLDKNEKKLMDKPLYSLASKDLQGVIDRAVLTHSPKTVRNYIGFIASAYKVARMRIPMVRLPEKERPAYHIPTDSEVKKMLADATGQLWVCIALAALGPMRAGEIAALKYTYSEDVDFDSCSIHVSKDYVKGSDRKYHLKAPKTASSDRVIVYPEEVMRRIREQGYVVKWEGGQAIHDHFSDFLEKEGLPHCRFHDLRHYCASYLHAKGYPDAYIQARTGHSSPQILHDVYTHVLSEEQKAITEEMLSDFGSLLRS